MTMVKICGITEPSVAAAAAEAGADYIGIVLAPSKRQVDVERAREISAAAKAGGALTVGVFVNTPAAEINRIAKYCDLDRIQLSGDEPWEFVSELNRPAIKAVKVRPEHAEDDIIDGLSAGYKQANYYFLPLLDCAAPGSYGGSGLSFDWVLARKAARRFKLVLAGGLTPENVGEAMACAAPWGVDVSSGVETDGAKDCDKIIEFIAAVRRNDDIVRKKANDRNKCGTATG